MRNSVKTFGSVLFAIATLAAAPLAHAVGGSDLSGGQANPYAMFCSRLGLTQVEVSGVSGVQGLSRSGAVCQFDFAQVEVSTLYNVIVKKQHSQALDAYVRSDFGANGARFGFSSPARAAELCRSLGATIQSYQLTMREDGQMVMCNFADGSSIEEWTLFWGPGYGPDVLKLLNNSH